MLRIEQLHNTNIVQIESDGTWESAEVDVAISELSTFIREHRQICLLERISTPGTSHIALFWDEIVAAMASVGQIIRVAVVGDESRIDVFSAAFRDELISDVRCFPEACHEEGIAWLCGSRAERPSNVFERSNRFKRLRLAL